MKSKALACVVLLLVMAFLLVQAIAPHTALARAFTDNNPVPTLTSIGPTSATAGSYLVPMMLSDGTSAVKDSIHNIAATLTGTPTTATLLGVTAPVISAAGYTSQSFPTASLGITPGMPISIVCVVNHTNAWDDGLPHLMFMTNNLYPDGPPWEGFEINATTFGTITFGLWHGMDIKVKSIAIDSTNWAPNVDHIIVATMDADGDMRLFVDGVEGLLSVAPYYGPFTRETALGTNSYFGVHPDGLFTLNGSELCAIYDGILTDSEIASISAMTNWDTLPSLVQTASPTDVPLSLVGTNFNDSSVVEWNGTPLSTTYVDATDLNATIPAADLKTAGAFPVTVSNPSPGGGTSAPQTFTVNNPVPTLTTITPSSVRAGNPDMSLSVEGTNFNASSVVQWNGTPLSTTYVDATHLTATIPSADLKTAGAFPVTVSNPSPGGGTSAPQTFTVNNPVPTLTSVTPSSATAGGPDLPVALVGTDFVPTSVVQWNGTPLSTSYVDAKHLTSTIPAADLKTAGTFAVTVSNPAPGGGTSGRQTFTVNNPVPTTTTLSPTSKIAGQPAFTLTVNGTNFVNGSVVKWKGANRTTTYVSATKLTAAIPASDIATAGTASVTVFNRTPGGGTSNTQAFIVTTTTWYLAEGTTAWGFSDYISIENPNASAVHASITYMTGSGNVSGGTITLPAKSQTTVNPADKLGNKDFSTKVVCTEGETIAVDRTMSWTGPGAASPEGHSSVGVTAPAKTWYLAEGSSAWNFECWLLIQNPSTTNAANCTVTYTIEGQGPKTFSHTVPKASRATFNMADDIGSKDASIKVTSNVPVIPERAMYRNNRREGHDSIGTTTPAADYYLAEGATGYNVGYVTYVLVQNPQDSPNNVTITYMTQNGQVSGPSFQMPANSRKTIRVNDQLTPNTDVSTHVHGSQPIIAERAMYWDNGTGEACHDSIGMGQPHTTFYLPDGQSSEGRETWTLVQNPNSSAVTVEVSYLKAGGGAAALTSIIPANSRKTFNMADKVPSGRASIMVTSTTPGKKIMVERSMYWNNRGAGTDTIGGYSD